MNTKRVLVKIALVASLAFSILIVAVAARFWVMVYLIHRSYNEQRDYLLHKVDYHAIAVACLDMMTQPEYKPLIDQYPSGDDPRLPVAIRDLKAFWLSVGTNEVMIMKTGGFNHMGIVFQRSTSVPDAYELVFREEGRDHDTLLYTLPCSTNAPVAGLEPTGPSTVAPVPASFRRGKSYRVKDAPVVAQENKKSRKSNEPATVGAAS